MNTLNDVEIMQHLLAYTKEHSEFSPYGACLVDENGEIKSYGVGNGQSNPANHAEIDAIFQCAAQFPDIDWSKLTMFSTGEPCTMCSSACCWANVKRVVYATDIPKMLALWQLESATLRCADVINAHPNQPELTACVCQAESDAFFESYQVRFQELINRRNIGHIVGKTS